MELEIRYLRSLLRRSFALTVFSALAFAGSFAVFRLSPDFSETGRQLAIYFGLFFIPSFSVLISSAINLFRKK